MSTLPLKTDEYKSSVLFPFFDGLIPEGAYLEWEKEKYLKEKFFTACNESYLSNEMKHKRKALTEERINIFV